jgi:hypothetical protein
MPPYTTPLIHEEEECKDSPSIHLRRRGESMSSLSPRADDPVTDYDWALKM